MSNLSLINRKIKSIKVTARLTHALEIISSTSMYLYRDLQKASLPYLQGIYKIFFEVFNNPDHDIRSTNKRLISYIKGREELLVILGTDVGMCGDFNDKIKKYVVNNFNKEKDGMIILGNKMFNMLSREFSQNIEYHRKSDINTNQVGKSINELSKKIFDLFMSGNYQKLSLVYMKDSKNGIVEKLNVLPFTEKYFSSKKKVFVRSLNTDVTYPTAVIDLFPQYLECIVLGAIISSKLGENLIRRELMHAAAKNANDLLDEYTITFNKLRQESITREINEIVVASQFNKKRK